MQEPVINRTDQPSGRYLLRASDRIGEKAYEATVVEWAPSGLRVKLKYPHKGYRQWVEVNEHGPRVVERLPDEA